MRVTYRFAVDEMIVDLVGCFLLQVVAGRKRLRIDGISCCSYGLSWRLLGAGQPAG